MKLTTKKLALCAVLTALALGLSTLENLFPVSLVVPLPGIKLGLANIVTVFALYQLGGRPGIGDSGGPVPAGFPVRGKRLGLTVFPYGRRRSYACDDSSAPGAGVVRLRCVHRRSGGP